MLLPHGNVSARTRCILPRWGHTAFHCCPMLVSFFIIFIIFHLLSCRQWSPDLPIRRSVPFKDDGNAWHFDGAFLGIVPNGTEPELDNSADCTGLPMSQVPWINVSLPVWRLVNLLIQASAGAATPLTKVLAEGAVLTGGIVLGPETWGRHWTVAEVKNRTLHRA